MRRDRSRTLTREGTYRVYFAEMWDWTDMVRATLPYQTEVMGDEIGYHKSRPMAVTSTTHSKNRASEVTGMSSWNFVRRDNPQPPRLGGPVKVSIDIPFLSPNVLTTDFDMIDWVSLTVGLADDVKGLLQSKSQLAVTFVEMHKTWKMVRNPFSLLRGDWRHIAGKSTCSQLARRGANLWLEGQYGWKPLFGDLRNFCDSSARWLNAYNHHPSSAGSRRFGSRAKYPGATPNPSVDNTTWRNMQTGYSINPIWSVSSPPWNGMRFVYQPRVVHAAVGCRASDQIMGQCGKIRQFLSQFGIDPQRDVLPTLWELVPYSFVVDWFINSQGIMNLTRYNDALGTLNQAGVFGLCYSVKAEMQYQAEVIPYCGGHGEWSWWVNSCIGEMYCPTSTCITGTSGKFTYYFRTLGLPPEQLPVLNGRGLSLSQLASGLSLLVQRLK